MALPPRTRIGNFKILKTLGFGGFGVTYVAWDAGLERTVVLKECFPAAICYRDERGVLCPRDESLGELYAQAMLDMRREACTLAKLNHEAIVRVYDVFESSGALYYVMPWLEGGSLSEKMQEAAAAGRMVDAAEAQKWLLRLLDGLSYLHEQGILHRDIKPSNIMFDEKGLPVLIDFGAAVQFVAETVTMGEFTAGYAAPEQVAGKGKVGPCTDLYALAATWYEVLGGCRPEAAVSRLLQDDLPPLELPGVSKVLVASIMRNLSLRADERCESAEAWRDWLLGAVRPPLPPTAGPKRLRAIVGGLVGLAVVGGGVLAWYSMSGEQAAPAESRSQKTAEALLPQPVNDIELVPTEEEKLYQRYCEQNQLQELKNKILQNASKAEELRNKREDAVKKWLTSVRNELEESPEKMKLFTATGPSVEALMFYLKYERHAKSMDEACDNEVNLMMRENTDIRMTLMEKCHEPLRHFVGIKPNEVSVLLTFMNRLKEEFLEPVSGEEIYTNKKVWYASYALAKLREELIKKREASK